MGLFDPTYGSATRGLFTYDPMSGVRDALVENAMTPPPPEQRREGPSRTRQIIGALGDVLAGAVGQPAYYMQMMQQRQQQAFEEQLRQRQRMDAREDKRWEWQNRPRGSYVAHPDPLQSPYPFRSMGDRDKAEMSGWEDLADESYPSRFGF